MALQIKLLNMCEVRGIGDLLLACSQFGVIAPMKYFSNGHIQYIPYFFLQMSFDLCAILIALPPVVCFYCDFSYVVGWGLDMLHYSSLGLIELGIEWVGYRRVYFELRIRELN